MSWLTRLSETFTAPPPSLETIAAFWPLLRLLDAEGGDLLEDDGRLDQRQLSAALDARCVQAGGWMHSVVLTNRGRAAVKAWREAFPLHAGG